MQHASAGRSVGSLIFCVLIAASIALMAPTPVALLLALLALPIEAYLVTSAIHGLTKPRLASRTVR